MVPVVPEIGRGEGELEPTAIAREEPDLLLAHLPFGRETALEKIGTQFFQSLGIQDSAREGVVPDLVTLLDETYGQPFELPAADRPVLRFQ